MKRSYRSFQQIRGFALFQVVRVYLTTYRLLPSDTRRITFVRFAGVDDVVAAGVGVISTREGTYLPDNRSVCPFPLFSPVPSSSRLLFLFLISFRSIDQFDASRFVQGFRFTKFVRLAKYAKSLWLRAPTYSRVIQAEKVIPTFSPCAEYCLCKCPDESHPMAIASGITPRSALNHYSTALKSSHPSNR